HSLFPDLIKICQPFLPIIRRVIQQTEGGGGHVVGDVAEAPFAAFPGGAVVGVVFVRVDAAAAAELFGLDGDGRGKACGGGLAKDADSAVIVGIGSGRCPSVV